jgi:hypothetical protein
VLRAHQLLTKAVTFAALFPWPRIVAFVPALAARFAHLSVLAHLATAHRVFTLASLALLVVWTNIRLVKAAWAIDAL